MPIFYTCLAFLLAAPAHADLFRYKDDKGQIHVVDSEDAVPEKFRAGMKHSVSRPAMPAPESAELPPANTGDSVKVNGPGERQSNGRSGENPCRQKKQCGIVYLAPWCPACKQVVPALQQLVGRNSESAPIGLKVVVGFGKKPGDNESMAESFGRSGVVDANGKLAKKLNVKKIPTFLVVDDNGHLLKEGNDARSWIHESFR